MTLLKRKTGVVERLDAPEHDARTLEESLGQVAAVNRWLGGRRSLLAHVEEWLSEHGTTSILDVGTGSADLPRAIVDHARRRGRRVRVRAVDAHPQMVGIARRSCVAYPEIEVGRADALDLPFEDRRFDLSILAMTLHHFEGDDPVRALQELARVSRRAVLVSDLERSVVNWLGALALGGTVWRSNPLTRHDGPLSVQRSFTASELAELAAAAGLDGAVAHRHFPYRLVLVVPVEAA